MAQNRSTALTEPRTKQPSGRGRDQTAPVLQAVPTVRQDLSANSTGQTARDVTPASGSTAQQTNVTSLHYNAVPLAQGSQPVPLPLQTPGEPRTQLRAPDIRDATQRDLPAPRAETRTLTSGSAALPLTPTVPTIIGTDTPEPDSLKWERLDSPAAPLPGQTGASATAPTPATAPQLVSQMAAQLLQIAQNGALHRREILLNPQELGRIKLNLHTTDRSVHVTIMIERPETLDLMRRHISELGQEFRQMGYAEVGFTFQDHTGAETNAGMTPGAPDDDDDGNDAPPSLADGISAVPFARPTQPSSGQLDLRI